jgi:hypothetical protein
VDLPQLLLDLHRYFSTLGAAEVRRLSNNNDKPLRMVKTMLHTLCKIYGYQVADTIAAIPELQGLQAQPMIAMYADINLKSLAEIGMIAAREGAEDSIAGPPTPSSSVTGAAVAPPQALNMSGESHTYRDPAAIAPATATDVATVSEPRAQAAAPVLSHPSSRIASGVAGAHSSMSAEQSASNSSSRALGLASVPSDGQISMPTQPSAPQATHSHFSDAGSIASGSIKRAASSASGVPAAAVAANSTASAMSGGLSGGINDHSGRVSSASGGINSASGGINAQVQSGHIGTQPGAVHAASGSLGGRGDALSGPMKQSTSSGGVSGGIISEPGGNTSQAHSGSITAVPGGIQAQAARTSAASGVGNPFTSDGAHSASSGSLNAASGGIKAASGQLSGRRSSASGLPEAGDRIRRPSGDVSAPPSSISGDTSQVPAVDTIMGGAGVAQLNDSSSLARSLSAGVVRSNSGAMSNAANSGPLSARSGQPDTHRSGGADSDEEEEDPGSHPDHFLSRIARRVESGSGEQPQPLQSSNTVNTSPGRHNTIGPTMPEDLREKVCWINY